MYRFPWYLTLVSNNHASSNPGQGSYNQELLQPGVFTTRGSYNQGSYHQGFLQHNLYYQIKVNLIYNIIYSYKKGNIYSE